MSIVHTKHNARGFTLVELLIVILIISVLTAMSMAALAGAAQEGKRQRARTQITKIDTLIMEKWNSYRYRQLPIRIPVGTDPRSAAIARLAVMREIMRMELPDRFADFKDPAAALNPTYNPIPLPQNFKTALAQRYANMTKASADSAYEQAECLYLIISQMRDGDRSAINFFLDSEIGDIDGDGMKEILDPWGNPIMFLRWAPGYSRVTANSNELQGLNIPPIEYAASTSQVPNGNIFPDPFDPLKADPRWLGGAQDLKPFTLKPLIFSGGPDKEYDIIVGFPTDNNPNILGIHHYSTIPPNDPYVARVNTDTNKLIWVGLIHEDHNPNPGSPPPPPEGHFDNITNHDVVFEGQ